MSPDPRLIAIGDVHGCAVALRAIVNAIQPRPDDTIVMLGDYVDRGPDSRGVIDVLLALRDRCHLVPLRGNHEVMMLQSFEHYMHAPMWVQCGGMETLDSYGGAPENVPAEHLDFLRSTAPTHETDNFIFVHANYDAGIPLAQQPDELLYWEHLHRTMPARHYSGKTVVVGHTPQKNGEILDIDHLICLDTYCFGGGWLTAMDLNSRTCWQVNREGELRPA